jgi:hypothetical protein
VRLRKAQELHPYGENVPQDVILNIDDEPEVGPSIFDALDENGIVPRTPIVVVPSDTIAE